MRIGLIGDIHGNAFALATVLAELDRLGVDRIVCLGDVATPGPWPTEVISSLMERHIACVIGNTDQWLLADNPQCVSDIPLMNEINAWAISRLSPKMVEWLAALPMQRSFRVGTTTMTLWHGSPRSTTETISALTPPDTLSTMLDGVDVDIAACGHTHVQLLRRGDAVTLINPGSIGLGGTGPGTPDLPPARPASGAEFAVLEVRDGASSVTFRHVDLDIRTMVAAAHATGMPDVPGWARLWMS